jgi:hypothetical protein
VQHPTFDLRLRDRRDVALAEVGDSPTTVTLAQKEGPLQLVPLSSGVVLVETLPGEQRLRIALPPGGYLVRRLTPEGVRSVKIQMAPGRSTQVDEASLTLLAEPSLSPKGVGQLEGVHALALSAGLLPGTWFNSWTVQAMYSWRFSGSFALRARALVGFPSSTRFYDELVNNFLVQPTHFDPEVWRSTAGADVEWLAWTVPVGPLAFTLGVSLGASAIGLGPNGAVHFTSIRLAASGTATIEVHLRSAPELALFAEGLLHLGAGRLWTSPELGIAPSSDTWTQAQANLGVAWHFR